MSRPIRRRFANDEISETGIPPTDDRESTILGVLNGGNYRDRAGQKRQRGVGLVEAYRLNLP